MDKRKSFLDILAENIESLQEKGIITEQELRKGIQIPIEWLYTSGIDREDIISAMESICHKVNSGYQTRLKYTERIQQVTVVKKNDELLLTIMGRDNWTKCNITDGNEAFGTIRNITTEQFTKEIYAQKLQRYMGNLTDRLHLTENDARQVIIQIFNETQKLNDLKGLSESLCEMSQNLGKYYEYMYGQKNKLEMEEKQPETVEKIHAGIVQMSKDEKIEGNTSGETKPHVPKQNDDYPYEQRHEILMEQKPIKLISFDTMEDGEVNPNSYVSYLFKNVRENGGYFLVIEPTQGNREGRIAYIDDETVGEFENSDEENEFWKKTSSRNIEFSKKEFLQEGNTAIYYHTTIEAFKQKFEYILSNKKTRKSSVIATANRTLRKLFGTEVSLDQLSTLAKGVSLRAMESARRGILEKEEDLQEEQK